MEKKLNIFFLIHNIFRTMTNSKNQYDDLIKLAEAAQKRLERRKVPFRVIKVQYRVYKENLILFTKIIATCIFQIYMSKKKISLKNVLIIFSKKLTLREKYNFQSILNDLWLTHKFKDDTICIKFPHTLPNQRILFIHNFVFTAIKPQKDELDLKLKLEYDIMEFMNSMRIRMENIHNKIHSIEQTMTEPMNLNELKSNKNLKMQELLLQQQTKLHNIQDLMLQKQKR